MLGLAVVMLVAFVPLQADPPGGPWLVIDPGEGLLEVDNAQEGVLVRCGYWGEMIAVLELPEYDDGGLHCDLYIDEQLVWATDCWSSVEAALGGPLPQHPWCLFDLLHNEAVTEPGEHTAQFYVSCIGQVNNNGYGDGYAFQAEQQFTIY